MALNYSLSKLLARQNARQMSREQALAELQAEQARIGQVTGALGALTQAGIAAGGAAQQIGQQAGEADALDLLAQQAKAKAPEAPKVEEPKPVGDKPPEPTAAAPSQDAELKALLEKQRAGMSAAIDPLGKQPEPVGVPAGGVAAAGKDIASLARQATPEEPKEKGFGEDLKDKVLKAVEGAGGAAGAALVGAGGLAGGPEGAIAADVMANDGTATRKAVAVTRDIAGDNANPTKAAERAGKRSDYQSTADVDAAIPVRPAAAPPTGRPRGPQGGSTKAPPPKPPSWDTTPAQQAAQIIEKAKTNDTWKNILSLGGYGRGQRDGLIKAIEEQRAQETAQFEQALKVYQSTGKFDMAGGVPAKPVRGAVKDRGEELLSAVDGIREIEKAAALPEARFRPKKEIQAAPGVPNEVSLEEMALNEELQRLEALEGAANFGGFSILSEAEKAFIKKYADMDVDSRLTPQQRALRQKWADVRNVIIKAQAGSAVTLPELKNALDAQGNPFKYGFGVSMPVMRELYDKKMRTLLQTQADWQADLGALEDKLVERLADSPYRQMWDGRQYVDDPDAPPAFVPREVGKAKPEPKAEAPKPAAPKAKAPKLSEALKKPTAAKPAVSPLRAQLDAAVAASRADPGDPAKRAAVRALLAQMRAAQ